MRKWEARTKFKNNQVVFLFLSKLALMIKVLDIKIKFQIKCAIVEKAKKIKTEKKNLKREHKNKIEKNHLKKTAIFQNIKKECKKIEKFISRKSLSIF